MGYATLAYSITKGDTRKVITTSRRLQQANEVPMSNVQFAVRDNSTQEVEFFDYSFDAVAVAKLVGNASVFAFHDGGLRVRHSYEVKNKRAYRINKVL